MFGWERARGIAPGFVVSCHVVAAPLFSDPSLCAMFIMSGVGIVELRVRREIPASAGRQRVNHLVFKHAMYAFGGLVIRRLQLARPYDAAHFHL